jgi:hypothetical protein
MGRLAPDADAFLARVLRLDPAAVVRLRPVHHAAGDRVELWARLPFEVLVSRAVSGTVPADVTVSAKALLGSSGSSGLPARRDTDWRWPLPPLPGRVVERLPAADVLRLGDAAAATLRTASAEGVGGRAVGSRALRDALLDHVPIVVDTDAGERFEVTQRLVQALVRMGFALPGSTVGVHAAGPWIGLVAAYGSAWYRRPLLLR